MNSFSNGQLGDNWGKEQLGKRLLSKVFEKISDETSFETIKDFVFKVAECKTKPDYDLPPQTFQGV